MPPQNTYATGEKRDVWELRCHEPCERSILLSLWLYALRSPDAGNHPGLTTTFYGHSPGTRINQWPLPHCQTGWERRVRCGLSGKRRTFSNPCCCPERDERC